MTLAAIGRRLVRTASVAIVAASILATSVSASSDGTVLYRFAGGTDGIGPSEPLLHGDRGSFYGTTANGGGQSSEGTVFEAVPRAKPGGPWSETILHRFTDFFEGQYPFAGLIRDRSGNLYGTTWLGGDVSCSVGTCGTVFELSPPAVRGGIWTYSVLHNFSGVDGAAPQTAMVADAAGNMYGTTSQGGTGACSGGCGVVFELSRSGNAWNETVLYNFPAVGHGEGSFGGTGAPVALDASGNLYGTGFVPGNGYGGAVFELLRPEHGGAWAYRNLYVFRSPKGGVTPEGGVTFDAMGNLYGTTRFGGAVLSDCAGNSCGTVFRLTPTRSGPWTHALLHSFTGNGDGGFPQDALTVDASGASIFGTTPESGSGTGCGCGTLFRMQRQPGERFALRVLHTFRGGDDGDVPAGGVVFGSAGALYGVTKFGGSKACGSNVGCGTVFSTTP